MILPRLRTLDLLRGIAVIAMIFSHAANAFLADSFKDNGWWYAVNMLEGYVAPTFLFLSGCTLWIAVARRRLPAAEEPARDHTSLWRRAITILALGYWLQIPVLSLRQLLWNHRPDELARMFDSNILHVVAIPMLVMLVLASVVTSLQALRYAALALAVGITLVASWLLGSVHLPNYLLPVRGFVSPAATFPLFPFAAYSFAGFFAAPILLKWIHDKRGCWNSLGVGLALLASGLLVGNFLGRLDAYTEHLGAGACYVVLHLGGIFLFVALVFLLAKAWDNRRGWLEFIGRKSLAFYLLHLMIIYGSPVNMGSRYWWNRLLAGSRSPVEVIGLATIVTATCFAAIWGWEYLRKSSPNTALWLKRLWWLLFWVLFLGIP